MKKFVWLFIVILSALPSFAEEPMKMVYFDNYAPFSWLEQNEMKGILVDVVTEALQNRMGIPLEHKGYPWARAQSLVKENKADAFVTVPTEERRSYTEISSEPALLVTTVMFAKKGSPKIEALSRVKTIPDLKDFTIGNYMGNGWGKKALEGLNVEWIPTVDQTLAMLIKGRFDVFIDVSPVVNFNLKRLGYQDQIVELPPVLEAITFNLCIGKTSAYVDLLPKFDETLRAMRDDGTLQKIYDNYK